MLDFDKYENEMEYPTRPTKPSLSSNASPRDYREYADKLEMFEKEMEFYKQKLDSYKKESARLDELFVLDLFDDLGISKNPKRHKLYKIAYEQGHSSGNSGIYYYATELVDLILD